jgi:pseudaminic acid biosynthesis-associated methylase
VNKQEKFWKLDYANEYIKRNDNFDVSAGIRAWATMLRATHQIGSLLELGPNIGRNIACLNHLLPDCKKSIVEISTPAFEVITQRYKFEHALNCSIMDSNFKDKQFDLVYTTGVLIHIAPENLHAHMEKMFKLSSRWILMCEMFSRVPKTVNYRNDDELLFTRDFGRFFLENFNVRVADYGFLWGHFYDRAGFDDGTWWLFEKI